VSGALLLDLDGVLFDSEPVHQRAWEHALAGLGVALPHGWYEGLSGRSLLDVAAALSRRHAPGHPAAALAVRKRAAYQGLADGLPPSPGVLEALAELRPRAALVTSSGREDVAVLLRGSGLPGHLETVVTGDDVPAPKPDPAGYLLALGRLDLPAGRCVAVEDSSSGVRAAVAAGLRVVAVAPDGRPPPGASAWRATTAEAIRLAAATLAS
jgi:HAD superfamily hydrolase (TIGR01509 family)